MFPIEWRWTYPRGGCFMSRIKLKTRAVRIACGWRKKKKNTYINIYTSLHINAADSFSLQATYWYTLATWLNFTGFRWSSIFRSSTHFMLMLFLFSRSCLFLLMLFSYIWIGVRAIRFGFFIALILLLLEMWSFYKYRARKNVGRLRVSASHTCVYLIHAHSLWIYIVHCVRACVYMP